MHWCNYFAIIQNVNVVLKISNISCLLWHRYTLPGINALTTNKKTIMLENIINQVKGQLAGELQDKFQLQPDTASRSVDLAKKNMLHEVKSRATSGDVSGVMNMLKGGQGASGTDSIISKYVGDLTSKLGIPESIAKQVAPFAISFIMQKVSGKMASDNLGQSEILGSLVGGNIKDTLGKGLGDKLGGLFK